METEGPTPKPRLSIPEWDKGDRPRERLLAQGAKALSDAELVAILIRSGTPDQSALELAKQVLKQTGNDLNALAALTPADLMKRKGVGEAKALSIVAALELGLRRRTGEQRERPRISTSAQVHEELRAKLADLPHEEFWVLLLDRGLRLIEVRRVSVVACTAPWRTPRSSFAAFERGASLVVAHNHPRPVAAERGGRRPHGNWWRAAVCSTSSYKGSHHHHRWGLLAFGHGQMS
jgi:DNA repair protein RadC